MNRIARLLVRLGAIVPVVALCALPASGGSGTGEQLSSSALHVMTSIDSLPSKDEIVTVFAPDSALERLKSIIAPTSGEDLGVQLRAIRALPQFCTAGCIAGDPAAEAIRDVIRTLPGQSDPDPQTTARNLLKMRAAIEALGIARVRTDEALLAPFLENASRDIRATTARALRDLCNSQAISPLRARLQHEQVEQVRLTISAALRDLAACP